MELLPRRKCDGVFSYISWSFHLRFPEPDTDELAFYIPVLVDGVEWRRFVQTTHMAALSPNWLTECCLGSVALSTTRNRGMLAVLFKCFGILFIY